MIENRKRGRKPKPMPELTPQQKVQRDLLFEKEIVPHSASLYHFAIRLTYGDKDLSKDLVQETLLRAYRFMEQYTPSTNAKAWLFRILQNTFINDYRKRQKEPSSLDAYNEASLYDLEDKYAYENYQDPTEGQIGDEVSRALDALPEEFRVVIILCDIEGFKYEEMSKILDLPIGTIRSRLHRARKILREMLMDYAVEMGYVEKS